MRQPLPRADFEQTAQTATGHAVQAVGEAHRTQQMILPIARRIDCVLGVDAGFERNLRRLELDLGETQRELLDDRQHLARMVGIADRQRHRGDAPRAQLGAKFLDGIKGPGDDALLAAIDRRQIKRQTAFGKPRQHVVLGQRDAEHGAGGRGLDELGATRDQIQGVIELEHAGDAGGGIFPQAVAGDGGGLYAPGLPQTRQRVLDGEEGRMRIVGILDPVLPRAEHHIAQVEQIGTQPLDDGRAAVEFLGEHRMAPVELRPHADILGTLAAELESDLQLALRRLGAMRHRLVKLGDRIGDIGDDVVLALREGGAARRARVAEIGQTDRRMAAQMLAQLRPHARQLLAVARRKRQQLHAAMRGLRVHIDALRQVVQHDVGVGAAKAERTDAGIARRLAARPGQRRADRIERRLLEPYQRMRRAQIQRRRQHLVTQRQQHLDQAGNAGCGQQMADVGLDAADAAVASADIAEGARQGAHLNRIADRRTCAVRLDIADLRRLDTGHLVGAAQHGLLAFRRRRHDADRTAIVIDRDGADHGLDAVAVDKRAIKALQHHQAETFTGHHAVRRGVEGTAYAIRRERAGLGQQFMTGRCRQQVHATGHGDVAIAEQQFVAGLLQRDE